MGGPVDDSTPMFVVELVGGRPIRRRGVAYPEIPRVYNLRHLGVELQHAIAFRHGVFVEHYRIEPTGIPGYYRGVYTGIRRCGELARRFDPARLPN